MKFIRVEKVFYGLVASSKLQRFDGNNFVTFKYKPENPDSLVFEDIVSKPKITKILLG